VVESRRLSDGRVVQRQVLYLGEIKWSRHNKLTMFMKCVLVGSCKMRPNCGSLKRSIGRSRH
jgi:hypothetical protein